MGGVAEDLLSAFRGDDGPPPCLDLRTLVSPFALAFATAFVSFISRFVSPCSEWAMICLRSGVDNRSWLLLYTRLFFSGVPPLASSVALAPPLCLAPSAMLALGWSVTSFLAGAMPWLDSVLLL